MRRMIGRVAPRFTLQRSCLVAARRRSRQCATMTDIKGQLPGPPMFSAGTRLTDRYQFGAHGVGIDFAPTARLLHRMAFVVSLTLRRSVLNWSSSVEERISNDNVLTMGYPRAVGAPHFSRDIASFYEAHHRSLDDTREYGRVSQKLGEKEFARRRPA